MLGFISTFLFFLAESGEKAGKGGFYDTYLNYPGLEAWKFVNLAIFVGILYYLLKKPLSQAFIAKRNAIRADLIKAEEAQKAAKLELDSASAKLDSLEEDKKEILDGAEAEAKAERERIASEAENDIARVQAQANTEVERKTAQVKVQLRKYSAEESIRLAEEKIKDSLDAAKDAELIGSNIEAIGGLK